MSDPASIFRLCSDVRFRRIHDEALVLRQGDAEVLGLNDPGAQALELLAAGRPLLAVLDELETTYEVARDELARDVDAFLDELVRAEVLERVEEPGP